MSNTSLLATRGPNLRDSLLALDPDILRALEAVTRGPTDLDHSKFHSLIGLMLSILLGGVQISGIFVPPEASFYYLKKQVIKSAMKDRNILALRETSETALLCFLSLATMASFQETQDPSLLEILMRVATRVVDLKPPQVRQLGLVDLWQPVASLRSSYRVIPSYTPDTSSGTKCDYCKDAIPLAGAYIQCSTCSSNNIICASCVPTDLGASHAGHVVQVRRPLPISPMDFSCNQCGTAISQSERYQCQDCSRGQGTSWDLCKRCLFNSACASHLLVVWEYSATGAPQVGRSYSCSQCGNDCLTCKMCLGCNQTLCSSCETQGCYCNVQAQRISCVSSISPCFLDLEGFSCVMCASFIESEEFLRCTTCGVDFLAPYNLCLPCAMETGWALHYRHELIVSEVRRDCGECERPINGARYECLVCGPQSGAHLSLCRACLRGSDCRSHIFKIYVGVMWGQPILEHRVNCDHCSKSQEGAEVFWHCIDCDNADWCQECLPTGNTPYGHYAYHSVVQTTAMVSQNKICLDCKEDLSNEIQIGCKTCGSYNRYGYDMCMECATYATDHHLHEVVFENPANTVNQNGYFECSLCKKTQFDDRYQCQDCSLSEGESRNMCWPCLVNSKCAMHTITCWEWDTTRTAMVRKEIRCGGCDSKLMGLQRFELCTICSKSKILALCTRCSNREIGPGRHNSQHRRITTAHALKEKCCDMCVSEIGSGDEAFLQCKTCTQLNDQSVDLCMHCATNSASGTLHTGHTMMMFWSDP